MMKWLRANSKQIMVVVVLLSMFGFLGSQAMIALFSPKGEKVKIASAFGKDITNVDLAPAQKDTQILENLFIGWKYDPQRKMTVEHWYVLSKEAERAGIVVSNQEVEQVIDRLNEQFKQMRPGTDFFEMIRKQHQITPSEIREALAKHIAIQKYAEHVTTTALPSEPQVRHLIQDTEDKVKLRMATLNAESFLNKDEPVSAEEAAAQFEKNKDVLAADSETGYGYKFSRRVKLQYLTANLPEIERSLKPDFEEIKNHWKANKSKYTKVKITEAPPTSGPTSQPEPEPKRETIVKDFSEAMPDVERDVRRKAALQIAEQAMQRAASLLAKPWLDEKTDPKTGYKPIPTAAQAPDFMQSIAKRIEHDFKIPIKYAETPLMTRQEISQNPDLRGLQTPGEKDKPLNLDDYAFRVPEFHKHAGGESSVSLQLFQSPDTALKATGFPFGDSVQRMGLFRVVEARDSVAPASVDEVRAQVEHDVRLRKAFDRMDKIAQELFAVSRRIGVKQAAAMFTEVDAKSGHRDVEAGPFARKARVPSYRMQESLMEGKSMTTPWDVPGVGMSDEFIAAAFEMSNPNWKSPPAPAVDTPRVKTASTQPDYSPEPKVQLVSIPKLKKKFVIEMVEFTPVDDEKFAKEFRQNGYFSLLSERNAALQRSWFSPERVELRTGLKRMNRDSNDSSNDTGPESGDDGGVI
jgi:hypothetical protein